MIATDINLWDGARESERDQRQAIWILCVLIERRITQTTHMSTATVEN